MKQKMSLSIYLQHKNYNCRGTLKGFIQFNSINKSKNILHESTEISRPGEITQEISHLSFLFRNVKLPYESYKGDYAIVKYFVKIIIIATYKNAEYEKEFAVVNPYDNSILKKMMSLYVYK